MSSKKRDFRQNVPKRRLHRLQLFPGLGHWGPTHPILMKNSTNFFFKPPFRNIDKDENLGQTQCLRQTMSKVTYIVAGEENLGNHMLSKIALWGTHLFWMGVGDRPWCGENPPWPPIPSYIGQTWFEVTTLPNLNPTLPNRPTKILFSQQLGWELLYLGLSMCLSVCLSELNINK